MSEKSVTVGGALLPNVCSLAPPKKAQLRAPFSPLQTAWTGFDPTRAGPAEDDPPLYKLESKPVQAVCKGESGTLN